MRSRVEKEETRYHDAQRNFSASKVCEFYSSPVRQKKKHVDLEKSDFIEHSFFTRLIYLDNSNTRFD